eukprot:GGOE01055064.1.p1 GENE.GGOE01055064.1~~GGOE01055064.1.p1  ORF type:complete len:453 (-),score=92.54 GGOE01055064.1:202-1518(-)
MGPKKTQSQPAAQAAPEKKVESPKTQVQETPAKIVLRQKASIGKRKTDCFFIFGYLSWAVIALLLFLANCEQLLPTEVNGVAFGPPICEALDSLEGPLRPFFESHQQWGKKMFSSKADFALDVVYYVNLLFVAPFAVLLALGFLGGFHFVKNLAIIHSTVLLYNMVIIDFYAYEALKQFDVLDLENVALGAFIIYGFFTIFPLVVLRRVWGDAPFSSQATKRGFLVRVVVFFVKQVLFLWMLLAMVGFYEFTVKHTVSMREFPSVVASSKVGWEQAGPLREQAIVKAAQFQEFAGEKLVEGVAAAKVLTADVAERVAKFVEDFQKKKAEAAPAQQPTKQAEPTRKPEPKAAEKKVEKAPPAKPKAPPAAPAAPAKPNAPPAPKAQAPAPPAPPAAPAAPPKPSTPPAPKAEAPKAPPAEEPKPQMPLETESAQEEGEL